MTKLVLLSVCVVMVALPLAAARDAHPARGLRRVLWGVLFFNLVVYVFVLRVVVPRLG